MSSRIVVSGPPVDGIEEILTPAALGFLADLHEMFSARRDVLLARRLERRDGIAVGEPLDFLDETAEIRAAPWRVAPIPDYLADRRVEISGPTDRKMTINALNSGAKVWLADLEDANTPAWENVIGGQVNLCEAIRRTIELDQDGKSYRLHDDELAVIVTRPRGWHLAEKHLTMDGAPLVGALVDFGLYFFHNAAELLARDAGPAFYVPKLESHLEARLWAEVFAYSESALAIPRGSIRATVLIETIWAAFEMDEILYELRDYAAGLNAGRWDYLFSIVKTFRDAGAEFVLPDRGMVTMAAPFMKAYSDLLVATCHRRGAYAIGGMAAFIPSRRNAEVNAAAFAKVRADKTREAEAGYEGSWVAHPDLVPICQEIFDQALGERVNQLDFPLPPAHVSAKELLDIRSLPLIVTAAGVALNVEVALEYVVNWLAGSGAVAINNLMEDAATAEISRCQLWQWRRNRVVLDDTRRRVDAEMIIRLLDAATERLADTWAETPGGREYLADARNLLFDLCTGNRFADFLTLTAYELLP